MGFSRGPSDLSAKWHVVRNESHDVKGKIEGHYIGQNSPATPSQAAPN
jgi:hypothetical protein